MCPPEWISPPFVQSSAKSSGFAEAQSVIILTVICYKEKSMGSSTEHQEMISVHEAKGMSSPPTESGAALHAKDFLASHAPVLIARRDHSLGREEGESEYARRTVEARFSTEAARAPELLQADRSEEH